MSVQMVLLPVFVLVGLTFFLLLWMATARGPRAFERAGDQYQGYRAGASRTGRGTAQVGNCFSNQFEVPVLFYVLIALALPLRHADLFIVLMSWVFVVTRFVHAGILSPPTMSGSAARRGSPACWCCSRCGSTSR